MNGSQLHTASVCLVVFPLLSVAAFGQLDAPDGVGAGGAGPGPRIEALPPAQGSFTTDPIPGNSVPLGDALPDAWIESVEAPEGLIGIPSVGEYRVTVCRDDAGPPTLVVPVTVAVGNPPIFSSSVDVVLKRGGCRPVNVLVGTPPGPGGFTCGELRTYPVLACANLIDDAGRSNDCAATVVHVEDPYFDVEVKIVGEPSSAWIAPCWLPPVLVSWDIVVTNHGNVTSPAMCLLTGIVRDPGPGIWYPSVDGVPWERMAPELDPGASSAPIPVDGYPIWCETIPVQQWIKVEVNYGCSWDTCGTGGGNNFDQEPIQLHY